MMAPAGVGSVVGPLYVDSSALAKVYLAEPESGAVDRLLEGRTDLHVSDLAITEVISAGSRYRREGAWDSRALGRFVTQILSDVEAGLYVVLSLDGPTHREAERVLVTQSDVPLRTLDALHLALAVTARARTVVTFDSRLAAAAGSLGLECWPPPRGPRHRQKAKP